MIRAAVQGAAYDAETTTASLPHDLTGLSDMAVAAESGWGRPTSRPTTSTLPSPRPLHPPGLSCNSRSWGSAGEARLGPCHVGEPDPRWAPAHQHQRRPEPGEAHIHGMNGITESVRQIRGTAVNQVPDAEHVLVTAGTGVPTSAPILGRPQGLPD